MKACSNPMCPLTQALTIIGGKWKPIIVYQLHRSNKRFGQLDVAIPGISRKVLTTQLNELVNDGLVTRHSYPESPPRVEYRLTDKGTALIPIFGSIADWGSYLVEEYKLEAQGARS
ncbi:MAG: helix-turn-helix transcriptional regulator [bacterium]|nr:helix-turn-helix transcriptional regulator [bacterium]